MTGDGRNCDHTYNGWSNYETWATALWIDNDQGSYEQSREIVRECVEMAIDPENVSAGLVGEQLKEWAEELFIDPLTEELPASLGTDLLRAAWSEVDWYEIAANWLSEL